MSERGASLGNEYHRGNLDSPDKSNDDSGNTAQPDNIENARNVQEIIICLVIFGCANVELNGAFTRPVEAEGRNKFERLVRR